MHPAASGDAPGGELPRQATPWKPGSSGSQSSPALNIYPEHAPPARATRQVQHLRAPSGGLYSDAPPWKVGEPGTSPVLPSRHRSLSVSLWSGLNACYELRPEPTEYKEELVPQGDHFPTLAEFRYPRDRFTRYTEKLFQSGNQQMMRKGGGTLAKSK